MGFMCMSLVFVFVSRKSEDELVIVFCSMFLAGFTMHMHETFSLAGFLPLP